MLDFLMFAAEPFGTWGPGPGFGPLDWWENAWVQGLILSLIVGGVFTLVCFSAGERRLTRDLNEEQRKPYHDEFDRKGSVPGWMMGLLERAFFTFAVALDPPAAIAAMPVWLGVKLAANWQRAKPTQFTRSRAILAVVIGLLGMLFALLGGMTWRGFFGEPPIWIKWLSIWIKLL